MTHLEALAFLSRWAADPAVLPLGLQHAGSLVVMEADARAARSHGLAAVRAIRSLPACSCSPFTCYTFCTCLCHKSTHITEARLAFRAALRAVGLRAL